MVLFFHNGSGFSFSQAQIFPLYKNSIPKNAIAQPPKFKKIRSNIPLKKRYLGRAES